MIDFKLMTEKELVQELRNRLEKREFMRGYYFSEAELFKEIYEILFWESEMEVEEIEQYFIPFGQSGYLSARRKLELMLFILEKDYGNTHYFLQELADCSVFQEDFLEQIYQRWALEGRLILSEEEKREFFVQVLTDQLGLGVVALLCRIAEDGIFLGALCPPIHGQKITQGSMINSLGRLISIPFLEITEQEELIRIIQLIIAGENKGELTMMEPFWECVREDGCCITAVRPPMEMGWGIRILYGAVGREQREWAKRQDL